MKNLLPLLLILLIASCDPCEDESSNSFPLNSEEKSIIQIPINNELKFINQDSVFYTARYSMNPSRFVTEEVDDEECYGNQFQIEQISFTLDSTTLQFEILIKCQEFSSSIFTIYDPNSETIFSCQNSSRDHSVCESKSINKDGVNFENVFELIHSISERVKETILYSPEKGIEYIELSDGRSYQLIS